MGRCSVLGCKKNNKKHTKITLHRLPKCKERKEKWLDILGAKNLNTTNKNIFICSLHFEDKCFNRTLDVTRLRDDALPSSELLISAQLNDTEKQQSFPRKVFEEKPTYSTCNYANVRVQDDGSDKKQSVSLKVFKEKPTCTTFNYAEAPAQFDDSEKQDSVPHKVFEEKLVCGTTNYTEDKTLAIIQKLKSKYEDQKKKIKRLNEKVRRQSKKIADFKTLIKDLKDKKIMNDEYASVLEQSAGPKDLLKRQIAKSVGLPMEKQYSEEIRKFALTLHFLSPKAYNFVRRTYSTCLPHPRTLSKW